MFVVFRENESKEEESFIKLLFSFIKSRLLLVVHHLFLPFFIFPIFMGGLQSFGGGDCLVAAGFLLEASTPFVSLRKILAILGEFCKLLANYKRVNWLFLFRPEEVNMVHNKRSCHDLRLFLLSSDLFPDSLLSLFAGTR